MTSTEHRPGEARSTGPSLQELLDTDTREVPVALREESYVFQGQADVPKSRYTSPEFAALEAEHLWSRSWQMACHEDQIPRSGDHVVYDVADQSLIVTRTSDGSIRAYHNACLHRGTKLRVDDGRVASFRCPFHGWRWSLDGELSELPCQWDFPQVVEATDGAALPEAQVATWAGWVFVNFDLDAEPFETYAAKLIEHFESFPGFAERRIAFHAVKEVPANWKVVMEAFSEGYHVIATHPQILEFTADANSEYSIWADSKNVSRFVNGFGVQSPHLGELTEQQVADAYAAFSNRNADKGAIPVADGQTARQAVAETFRAGMAKIYRSDLTDFSDAEILDAILYHLFPAFAPWAGVGQPLVYRWRPGPTPDTSFMDVYRMAPPPDGEDRPAPAPTERLLLEQSWKESKAMGGLADVFEQDMANLPRVQAGLKSTGKPTVSFGLYQEARLRMFHRLIDERISSGLAAQGRSTDELEPFAIAEG
ncbi:MAG: aromatic ring-hydroxylating dioxygenase subunit alpha [Actinomycetota bacterium]